MLGRSVIRVADQFLAPANRRLARAGVTPPLVNGLEFASGIACGACFAQSRVAPAVVLLVLHGFFDYLDGGLQRAAPEVGQRLARLPFMHTITDKLSDVLLFLSLALGGWVAWGLGIAASAATVAASLLGWWGQQRQRLQRETCLFDRSDRILVLLVLSPFRLFTTAVLATVIMNLAVVAQRMWSLMRSRRQVGSCSSAGHTG